MHTSYYRVRGAATLVRFGRWVQRRPTRLNLCRPRSPPSTSHCPLFPVGFPSLFILPSFFGSYFLARCHSYWSLILRALGAPSLSYVCRCPLPPWPGGCSADLRGCRPRPPLHLALPSVPRRLSIPLLVFFRSFFSGFCPCSYRVRGAATLVRFGRWVQRRPTLSCIRRASPCQPCGDRRPSHAFPPSHLDLSCSTHFSEGATTGQTETVFILVCSLTERFRWPENQKY